jgi:hypothetical protein
MGYVPGFINDIFISYSHKDDQAVSGPGWVTDFHQRLSIEVEEALGDDVQIWRDKRITGATDFTKDLEKQIRGSAILLAILSPAYVKSKWCDWELKGFAGSRRVGDLWVDTKCRAIKVIKRPPDAGTLRVLAETEGVKFFDVDPSDEVSYETDWSSVLHKQRLTVLGNDIKFILSGMRKARSVFLGMASPSLRHQRERVRQELIGRDYRVLTAPDASPDAHRISVGAAVKESALSILFYDRTVPVEQSAEALAALEREVALDERAKQIIVVHGPSDIGSQLWDEPGATGRGSARVEWLIEPQTHKLYHTVLQMLGAQVESDATPDDVRALGPEAPEDPAPPTANGPARPPYLAANLESAAADRSGPQKLVRVYLVCDRQDHPLLEPNRARRLRDHLLSLGFEVKLPLADDDGTQFSRDNRTKLKQCDAVLVYWGTARQGWFDGRLKELEQARGWRQGRAFAALGAYVADPGGPVKENYETRELDELIKQIDSFDLTDARLVRFVARLGQAT